jgi:hypothetical protein
MNDDDMDIDLVMQVVDCRTGRIVYPSDTYVKKNDVLEDEFYKLWTIVYKPIGTSLSAIDSFLWNFVTSAANEIKREIRL